MQWFRSRGAWLVLMASRTCFLRPYLNHNCHEYSAFFSFPCRGWRTHVHLNQKGINSSGYKTGAREVSGVLAFHIADLSLNPSIPYAPELTRRIPEYRNRSNPWVTLGTYPFPPKPTHKQKDKPLSKSLFVSGNLVIWSIRRFCLQLLTPMPGLRARLWVLRNRFLSWSHKCLTQSLNLNKEHQSFIQSMFFSFFLIISIKIAVLQVCQLLL